MKKSIKIPCDCVGGEKHCGSIIISNLGDKDIEICFIKYGRVMPIHGVYLKPKSIGKLLKFLLLQK